MSGARGGVGEQCEEQALVVTSSEEPRAGQRAALCLSTGVKAPPFAIQLSQQTEAKAAGASNFSREAR